MAEINCPSWCFFSDQQDFSVLYRMFHPSSLAKGILHILRRNPERAIEIRQSRDSKLASLRQMLKKQNEYLAEHPRASPPRRIALRKLGDRCEKLKVSKWVKTMASDRKISLAIDQEALAEIGKLDGCYVIETDLNKKAAGKTSVMDS